MTPERRSPRNAAPLSGSASSRSSSFSIVQAAWLVGLLTLALRDEGDFPYVVGLSVCLLTSAGLAFLISRYRGTQE